MSDQNVPGGQQYPAPGQPQGQPQPGYWPAPGQAQPGWVPPTTQPPTWDVTGQQWQAPGTVPSGPQWSANPQPPASPPVLQPPAPRGPRRWPALLALALAASMIVAGVLSVPLLTNRAAAGSATSPAPTGTPLVTATPSPQPTAQTVLTSGGDVGSPVRFTTSTGTGSLTITRATWTYAGRMAPPEGKQYLIVEATVACASGELDLSSLSLRSSASPADQSAFGPELDNQFPGVRLTAGKEQSGQVGFVLPAGEVTIALLAPDLKPVAERRVPAP